MALEQEGRVDVGQVGRSLSSSPFSDKLCYIISFLPSPFTQKHFPSFVLLLKVNLLKVNDQIARLFFPPGESSSYTSGGRPSYAAPGTGYGPPSQVTFAVKFFFEEVFSQSPTGPYYPSSFYYQGFEDDIYLLIKLSHVALIVFIIFAIVTMIYLVVSCCVSFTRRREKEVSGKVLFTIIPVSRID